MIISKSVSVSKDFIAIVILCIFLLFGSILSIVGYHLHIGQFRETIGRIIGDKIEYIVNDYPYYIEINEWPVYNYNTMNIYYNDNNPKIVFIGEPPLERLGSMLIIMGFIFSSLALYFLNKYLGCLFIFESILWSSLIVYTLKLKVNIE